MESETRESTNSLARSPHWVKSAALGIVTDHFNGRYSLKAAVVSTL